jgi:protein-S-isoprenylcysteine O-methyltransferase Ste14
MAEAEAQVPTRGRSDILWGEDAMKAESTGSSTPQGSPPEAATETAGVIAPPPLIVAIPLVVGLLVNRWIPVRVVPAGAAAPVGIACLLLGLLGLPAILAFRRAHTSPEPWRPTTALVTTGPYRFSRNPMYVGFTLFYAGVGFWVNAVWPFVLLPVVILVMRIGVIAREEAYLERRFGEEYREYQRRVRRWL